MARPSEAKTRLVQTALQLIHSRSYSAVSVEDLCLQAQVNKGSFYYFFPSKRELLLEALEAHWEITRQEVFEPAFSSQLPVLERITRAFENAYSRHKSLQTHHGWVLGCPFGNLALELSTQDEIVRQKIQEIFSRICAYFEKALNEAIEIGLIPAGDVPLITYSLLAYFEGTILLAKTQNDAELIHRLGQDALKLVGAY